MWSSLVKDVKGIIQLNGITRKTPERTDCRQVRDSWWHGGQEILESTNDLRSFKSVPTQYNGNYACHLPSYDKMSYCSAIVDLLLDIEIYPLSMSWVTSCSVQSNAMVHFFQLV